MIWNAKADNYSAGVTIYDPNTGQVYSEEEASKALPGIRNRLCVRANKIGAFVKETGNETGKVHKLYSGRSHVACARPLTNGMRAEDDWKRVSCKRCLDRKSVCLLVEKMMGEK